MANKTPNKVNTAASKHMNKFGHGHVVAGDEDGGDREDGA